MFHGLVCFIDLYVEWTCILLEIVCYPLTYIMMLMKFEFCGDILSKFWILCDLLSKNWKNVKKCENILPSFKNMLKHAAEMLKIREHGAQIWKKITKLFNLKLHNKILRHIYVVLVVWKWVSMPSFIIFCPIISFLCNFQQ
jgi:hypothetical protein